MPKDEIDERVRKLVDALNRIPHLETFSSCGGHENQTRGQLPAGQFCVHLKIRRTKDGWNAVEVLADAMAMDRQRIRLIPTISDGALFDFELRGQDGVDPDQLAAEIDAMLAAPGSP